MLRYLRSSISFTASSLKKDQWISIFLEKPRSSWLDCLITGRGELYSLRALICTVPFESYGKNPRIVLMWSHFCVKVTIRLAKTAVSFPSDILSVTHSCPVCWSDSEPKFSWGEAELGMCFIWEIFVWIEVTSLYGEVICVAGCRMSSKDIATAHCADLQYKARCGIM